MSSNTTKFKQNILKIGFESSLIIFSVLLALVLNEYRGQLKTEKEKARAMQMIEREINNNVTIINNWIPYHDQVITAFDDAINELAENPTDKRPRDYILRLMPKGLVQEVVSRSAWDSLQQVSASVSLDIETIFLVSKVYKLQEIGVEHTLMRLIEIMNSREAMRNSNLEETLYLMKATLQELVAQERQLVYVYEKALTDLKQKEAD